MNKRHYEHTLPNIRGSLSNTYILKYSDINMFSNRTVGIPLKKEYPLILT